MTDERPEVPESLLWPTSDGMTALATDLTDELKELQSMIQKPKLSSNEREEFDRRMDIVELFLRVFESTVSSYNARLLKIDTRSRETNHTEPTTDDD